MSTKKKTKSLSHLGRNFLASGLVAAATASVYLLYGSKNAEKNRKKIKGWMVKMKGEIIEAVEKVKEVDEEMYKKIVDNVSKKYKKLKNINDKELNSLSADLKKHWNNIKKEIKKDEPKKRVIKKVKTSKKK